MQIEMKVAADAENLAVRKIADQEIANRLNITAQELEQRAVNNIKANAELMSEMNVRLGQMNDAIELASRAIGTRAGLASRGYQEVSSRLNAVRSELGQREDEFFAQSKVTASEELAAVRQLDNGELATRLANLQTRLQSRQQP
jgi:hypothetical protein